jgi:hypothetical protein
MESVCLPRREDTVSEAEQILRETGTILVVDWPTRDVPETLARAGYTVLVTTWCAIEAGACGSEVSSW